MMAIWLQVMAARPSAKSNLATVVQEEAPSLPQYASMKAQLSSPPSIPSEDHSKPTEQS